jgi:hypothetical protein
MAVLGKVISQQKTVLNVFSIPPFLPANDANITSHSVTVTKVQQQAPEIWKETRVTSL